GGIGFQSCQGGSDRIGILSHSQTKNPGANPGSWQSLGTSSLADVWHQRHEACPLDGILARPLEGGAVATALPAEELALACAQLFQRLHVLVIHEGRSRAALLGAKATPVLPAPSKLLANHRIPRPSK